MSFSQPTLEKLLSDRLPAPLTKLSQVSGGDINLAFKATVANGEHFFVKTHPSPPRDFFKREAHGLTLLAETNTVSIPQVIAVIDGPDLTCLVLEWVEPGRKVSDSSTELGRGLARLHRATSQHFGLPYDNYIGTLQQSNTGTDTWAEFYRDRRLTPLINRAHDRGLLPNTLRRQSEQLLDRLPILAGPVEPPSLVHGDLWGGNRLVDQYGKSWLIDPAVYFGFREVDLAMMLLFGGFDETVLSAYHEVYPLSPDWRDRVALYQLYPMLVHLNLFGETYLSSVEQIIRRYA